MKELEDSQWQELYPRWNMDRFLKDSQRLEDDKKRLIYLTMLANSLGLTEEEADLFTQRDYLPIASDPERLMAFANVERKISDYFSGGKVADESNREMEKERFRDTIRETLTGFYSEEQLNELIPFMRCVSDEVFVVMLLCDGSQMVRRTRNAYLPAITTMVAIDRTTGEAQDLTHQLFDGETDAVGDIEKILGIERNESQK